MKILHIIPALTKGGAERLVTDIIRELSRRADITPALVILSDDIHYDIDDIKEYTRIIPSSVHISVTGSNKYNIGELQKFVNEFQPDVINSHLFYGDLTSKELVYPQAKHFSHVHDNMRVLRNFSIQTLTCKTLLANYYTKRHIVSRYLSTGNSFIAVSRHTSLYLKETLPAEIGHRIFELKNAINFKIFNQANTNRSIADIRIINIGSFFHHNKNQSLLVQVVKKLKDKGHNVHATFLGEGALRKDVMEYAEQIGLKNEVTFTGNVNNVVQYLKDANIYVHTSLSESFGLVLVEAMAAGLPVVTLNGKGNADLIKNGETGYMIDEPDADIFIDRILKVMSDQGKYETMHQNAINLARTYDIDQYTDRLLEIYSRRG